jgi:hypothetical protein
MVFDSIFLKKEITQIKVKKTVLFLLVYISQLQQVFNDEYNSYPKMSAKLPLCLQLNNTHHICRLTLHPGNFVVLMLLGFFLLFARCRINT